MHQLSRSLFVLAFAAAIAAQTRDVITIAEGSHSTSLTLRTYPERNPGLTPRTVLDRVTPRGIDITCRTPQMEFAVGRSRRVHRPDWSYIALPNGGKLFRYQQNTTPGRFGFLVIHADGQPQIVHEVIGSVAPYTEQIAVAPDGRHALVLMQSGKLDLVRLDRSTFAGGRTARELMPPGSSIEPLALYVGPTHAFFVTEDDRIWRCALPDGNRPQDLTPASSSQVRLKDELAPSGDGRSVAFLFGPKDQYSIYLLGTTGAARRLPPPPAKYEEPGYLPSHPGGPRMLLNEDGSRLMYTDATIRDEIYLLDTSGRTGTTHVTSDQNFRPYIGVGILPAFAAASLVIAIGDPARHDWYEVTTSSRAVVNLTKTGTPNRPHDIGQLDPASGFRATNGAIFATERTPTGLRLRHIDVARRVTTTLPLRSPMRQGSDLGGPGVASSVLAPSAIGDVLFPRSGRAMILQGPPQIHLSEEIFAPRGAFSLFAARDAIGGPSLPILHVPAFGLLPLPPVANLQQLTMTRSGGALIQSQSLQFLSSWIRTAVPGSQPIRIVLSGASTR